MLEKKINTLILLRTRWKLINNGYSREPQRFRARPNSRNERRPFGEPRWTLVRSLVGTLRFDRNCVQLQFNRLARWIQLGSWLEVA